MYSFCCHGVFIMKMKFAVNLVNKKVLDNLLICLVLKFHVHRPNSLRVIAFRILRSDSLVLWTDLRDVII